MCIVAEFYATCFKSFVSGLYSSFRPFPLIQLWKLTLCSSLQLELEVVQMTHTLRRHFHQQQWRVSVGSQSPYSTFHSPVHKPVRDKNMQKHIHANSETHTHVWLCTRTHTAKLVLVKTLFMKQLDFRWMPQKFFWCNAFTVMHVEWLYLSIILNGCIFCMHWKSRLAFNASKTSPRYKTGKKQIPSFWSSSSSSFSPPFSCKNLTLCYHSTDRILKIEKFPLFSWQPETMKISWTKFILIQENSLCGVLQVAREL